MANIEELISELTKAVRSNTEAIKAGKTASGGGSAGTTASTTTAAGTAAPKSKYTVEQLKAMAVRVRDEVSEDAAKEMIKKFGGGNLAELCNKKGVWDKFVAAAEKAIADATTAEEPTEDGDTGDL